MAWRECRVTNAERKFGAVVAMNTRLQCTGSPPCDSSMVVRDTFPAARSVHGKQACARTSSDQNAPMGHWCPQRPLDERGLPPLAGSRNSTDCFASRHDRAGIPVAHAGRARPAPEAERWNGRAPST